MKSCKHGMPADIGCDECHIAALARELEELRTYKAANEAEVEHWRKRANRAEPDAERYRVLRNSEWMMFEDKWLVELDIYGQGPADMDAALDGLMPGASAS